MLRLLVSIPQALVAGLALYNGVLALWGWRDRVPAPTGPPRRMRVVVPAHDEEAVIGNLITDLSQQTHPSDLTDVVVIADRCSDATVRAARPARAVERSEEDASGTEGKGAALAWYLSSEPLLPDEVLVVLDADNRVPSNLLERISDEIAAGHGVVQCYLDVANPDESALTVAGALSYWAGNRMVQLARSNLGWSADLGGTGMAFTDDALDAVGGFGSGLTEDQDLAVRMALAGIPVEWLHDVRVYDEKPVGASSTVRQRARWMAGKRQVARVRLAPLIGAALGSRSWRLVDVGIRLVQPGRSFVAAVSAAFTVTALVTRSRLLFPWWVWGAITAAQVVEPLPFLAKDGVERRYLIRYPLMSLIGVLWVPIRVASAFASGWGHTRHLGVTRRESDAPDAAP
jgi:cellulose synthase/poly-beta-1,6-N-acetylglucosamine synthase-like glycosyltransferase